MSEFGIPRRRNIAIVALGSLFIGGLGFWWKGGTFLYDVWLLLGALYLLAGVLAVGGIVYVLRLRWRLPVRIFVVLAYAALFAIIQTGFLPLSGLRAHLSLTDAKTYCLLIEQTIKTEASRPGSPGGIEAADRLTGHLEKPRYPVSYDLVDGTFQCSIFPANRLSDYVTYSAKDGKWRRSAYRGGSRQGS